MQADVTSDDTKQSKRDQSRKARRSRRQNVFAGMVIGGTGTFYTGLYSLFFTGKFDLDGIDPYAAFTHGAVATSGGMAGGILATYVGAHLDEKLSKFAGKNPWRKAAVAVPRALVSVGFPIAGLVAGGAGTYRLTESYAFDMGEKVHEIHQDVPEYIENLQDVLDRSNHGDTIHVNGDSTLVLKHLEMTP